MPTKHIGFLQLFESGDSYIGAILVTDLTSVPVEFRVTLPVRPTSIQRSLYGRALAPFVGVELCGKPLLGKVTHDLELIFVAPDYMLGLRPGSNAPIVHARKTDTPTETIAYPETSVSGVDQNHFELPGGHFQPIALFSAPGFSEDLDAVRPLVEQLWSKFDLLEPFDRIEQTLVLLREQDPKFSQ
jgi:hypothetical protein